MSRAAAVLVAAILFAAAAFGAPTEYRLKAVFLFNFAQFVEWPPNAFESPQAPLVIGVLGEDPFGAELDSVVGGETVRGRPIVVHRYPHVKDIQACHILFIARSEQKRLRQVLGALAGRSILTVGDFEGFTASGGMIRFMPADNRIRLRVNVEAAQDARLTISSKLLRPAEIVARGQD